MAARLSRRTRRQSRSSESSSTLHTVRPQRFRHQNCKSGTFLEPSAYQGLPPFALLHLPLPSLPAHGPADNATAWPVQLRWPLAPRATVWKYCLFGDWPEPALAVVDLAGETEFSAPAPDRLDNGTPMLAIRSRVRLPLAQRSPRRFQLRSRPDGAGSPKVLIRRLPTAAAQLLARETIDGQPTIVSEIHVHR